MFKRVITLGGLTGLLAAFAIAIPASAAGVKAACVVSGEAKTTPPVQLVGGGGTYTFNSLQFVCVGTAKGGLPQVVPVNVTSNGSYVNVVCGTGKAFSKPTQSTAAPGTDPKYAALVSTLGYEVEFVGTVGVFNWKNTTDKNLPEVKPLGLLGVVPDPKPGSNSLGGVVVLTAPSPLGTKPPTPPAGTNCTKAFGVVGVLLVEG